MTSCRTTSKKKKWKKVKNQDSMSKTNFFLAPYLSVLGQFQPHGYMYKLLRKYMKNELKTHFEQNFTACSYGVRIWYAWCSQKACEIYSSLIQKKKNEKKYFSSHKLPKLQLTSFWFQGISEVKRRWKLHNTIRYYLAAKQKSYSMEQWKKKPKGIRGASHYGHGIKSTLNKLPLRRQGKSPLNI